MKLIAGIFVFLVASAAAIPLFENEEVGEEFVNEEIGEEFVNEEIGEEFVPIAGGAGYVKEEDWHLVPDTDGHLRLVDINSVDMEMEPLFNAMNDVVFRIWTRQNTGTGQIVQLNNNAQLSASNFNPALPTRFHAHGWNGGGATTGAAVRSALLTQTNCNVVVVDWGAGAQTANYVLARNRVNEVGNVVALYANWLVANGASWATMSFIGHSLGAHVAGAAGKRTSGTPQSIVGLDPAGPLFSLADPANRIHHTDAHYTECQVTDAGRLGFEHPVCHANFYPNWGTSQPGCGVDITGNCGHSLVNSFYAASINNANVFGATRCRDLNDIRNRNCVQNGAGTRMGMEPVVPAGAAIPVGSVFFLTTSGTHPFAHGPR